MSKRDIFYTIIGYTILSGVFILGIYVGSHVK